MLKEIENVRQIEGEGKRRWFTDEYFDLIIWYDKFDKLLGFQLCYDVSNDERALTWKRGDRYIHEKVDAGEIPYQMKETPITVADGVFDKETVAEKFRNESVQIDRDIANFIYEKIVNYHFDRNLNTSYNTV
jgi:hypothetical protein